MPELPDIVVYVEALDRRVTGELLETAAVHNPFVLRTFAPALDEVVGKQVQQVARVGKRIAVGLEEDLWVALHLMIAGRLQWNDGPGEVRPRRGDLATFRFSTGTLRFTEAGRKHRASLHVLQGPDVLSELDPGGLDVRECTLAEFTARMQQKNQTVKRALTTPALFSGIGNAYSDEILHRAQFSPFRLTQNVRPPEWERLFSASRETLDEWTSRLREQTGSDFPRKVTAFRPEMAVHGRFGEACPVCGATVQRICYSERETSYCPTCQTGGKILADRSLSRLLKSDWPARIEEWESH
ncbi:putative formamidopyrimidine-DNA glycosylase-like protein [Maioricimonas rarisocia]|uniref:Putative formamidopyrimidine-DNA glycosylase-like protein n=1 Tax=Maioricimonas rarisocia TaxID=2528026 RepID=A0A517Z2H0_9PLAN|nr:DNA-formamidopyrimidine glycosylase family protein [Maioricimonas rarisocia]QDU36667.1 putative formamidopyrimidine-DNA glycosylase-like protein [Maioricimonas rarisocia]